MWGIVPYAGQGGRLFVGGIVIPAKLQVQVGEAAGGGVVYRVLGNGLGSGLFSGAYQGFHAVGDLVRYGPAVEAEIRHGRGRRCFRRNRRDSCIKC